LIAGKLADAIIEGRQGEDVAPAREADNDSASDSTVEVQNDSEKVTA
jgi:hypothetical protein